MENILITGGAGFIGTNLAQRLLDENKKVIVVDNFNLGNKENLTDIINNPGFTLYEEDVTNIPALVDIMKKHQIDMVYHMAANSDIQKSAADPHVDFHNTFETTYGVLEAMRQTGVKQLFFASTSAVYGEKIGVHMREDIGELSPISYYGGAKLASEAFISSYAYMNDLDVTIFRFANVIGPKLTHGVIYDFVKKLKLDPKHLQILGDGTQNKPYIYVKDLVDAIVEVTFSCEQGVNIYNIGDETSTTVTEIADMVCTQLKLEQVEYSFTSGNRGWKGDVPSFRYDLTKIHNRGWRASHTSNEAVQATLDSIVLEEE